MKRCVFYANCQADGIALFLRKMEFPYEITVFRNYQIILGEQKLSDLEAAAKTCDLFIYQPTNDKHGDSSSENALTMIPVTAESISFAYIYNHGLHPLTEYGGKYPGSEFMNLGYWQMPLHELLRQYDDGVINFALWPRFLNCLAEQAAREQFTDLKITRFMMQNLDRRLLLNVNHPTSILFVELARLIFHYLGIEGGVWLDPYSYQDNETGLPCTIPFSPYVYREFNVRAMLDPQANEYYRALLASAYAYYNA